MPIIEQSVPAGLTVLGDITITAGTPITLIDAFASLPYNIEGMMVRLLLFSARHLNTGRIFIGDRRMAASGGNFTSYTLGIPPATGDIPFYHYRSENDNNNVPVGQFVVDGTVNGDIVRVSVMVG